MPGATITARHVATNTLKVGVTNEVGQYYLPNLRAGEYEVVARATGGAEAAARLRLVESPWQ